MRICLTISDCPALEMESARRTGDAERGIPAMAALTRLARFADRHEEADGWRAVAWRAAFDDPCAAPAVVAAWATDVAPGEGVWLAQPVRLTAAADHLRLHGAGLMYLEDAEARDWIDAYGATFGGGLPRLRAVAGGFLLEGIEPGAGPPDPAERAGTRLDSHARGGSKALRRQAAELELWLHEHSLNARRARHGLPPITALWLWGGGAASAPPSRRSTVPLRLFGDDAFVAGLGAALGVAPAVASLPAVLDAPSNETRVVQVSARATVAANQLPLERIDREWIAPLAAAVADRRVDELEIAVSRQRFVTRRSHRLRWWRRARPWWDTVAR